MAQEKKIYCGSGKKKAENWLQISINPEKFGEYVKEYNGNKYLRLNVNILSQPDKYGKDVSVSIDTWEPKEGYKGAEPKKEWKAPPMSKPAVYEEDNDLPF
jgi:hypothetical protein